MVVETNRNQKIMFGYFSVFSLVILASSFFANSLFPSDNGGLISGWVKIMTSPAALTMDYTALGGLGSALLNAGVMGLIIVTLFKVSKAELAAPSFLAFFLTLGFSLFGINPINTAPIIFGVFIYSRIKKEPFSKHVNASFFGCAVAPVISEVLFSYYVDTPLYFAIPMAVLVGTVIGCVFVPMLTHCVNIHKGNLLFNAGVAAGFLAFLSFGIYRTLVLQPLGVDADYKLNGVSSPGFPMFFAVVYGALFLGSIVLGILLNKKEKGAFGRLISHSGHGVDYISHASLGSVYINLGSLGLAFLTYFISIGAPINGPVMGALMAIVASSASGSHLRNTLTILLGYVLVSLFSTWSLSAQGMCVALCYGTCLSPTSGRYGYLAGIAVGALHSCLVPFVATIYGGFNLYNGGFTAGLILIVALPPIEAISDAFQARKAGA